MSPPSDFSSRLVSWQRSSGRHDLPWQQPRTPYRVWISEIMLQQTQVQTVVGYFDAFIRRFPDVPSLAVASEDEVLAAWSGLGYYSRARYLHRCAKVVMSDWGGQLPRKAKELQLLPGIGPSTAAAIASLCEGERVAIMDGNVQRVMTRWFAFDGDLSLASAKQALLDKARDLLPRDSRDMPSYTQGIMDLGATVCKPKQPNCPVCPLKEDCKANGLQQVSRFPIKTRRLKRQSETWWMLFLQTASGQVALIKRPEQGVWASLWCFPMFSCEEQALAVLPVNKRSRVHWQEPIKHVLTHRDWWLSVGVLVLDHPLNWPGLTWMGKDSVHQLGLPQPVRSLLASSLKD